MSGRVPFRRAAISLGKKDVVDVVIPRRKFSAGLIESPHPFAFFYPLACSVIFDDNEDKIRRGSKICCFGNAVEHDARLDYGNFKRYANCEIKRNEK